MSFIANGDGNFYFWPAFINNRGLTNWSAFGVGWNHFVAVFDGTGATDPDRLKLFINGTARTVTYVPPISNSTGASANNLRIGSQPAGAAFSDGKADDIRIFDQLLTLADVQFLYAGGLGRGITAGSGIIPILRQHYAAQGAR
jgi:hypothetical protein